MSNKELVIGNENNQMNFKFLSGMNSRMEAAFHSYGDYEDNYTGKFVKPFLQDVKEHLDPLIEKYKRSGDGNGTSASCNAIIGGLERLLLYLVGGPTRGGEVKAGNTEYLIDAANFFMIEFNSPQAPKAKFVATDFMQSPGLAGMPEKEAEAAATYTYKHSGD